MSRLIFCCALVLASLSQAALLPTDFSIEGLTDSLSSSVRVRLDSNLQVLEISGRGIRVQGSKKEYLPVAIPQSERVQISTVVAAGQTLWKVKKSVGSNSRTELVGNSLLRIEGAQLMKGAKSLPSKLFLTNNSGRVDLIGVLPLESYLVGVLASEMPLQWPLESLRAQAVAARSYSLAVMKERKNQLFHLESSVRDQVFRHVADGVDHDPMIEKAFEAVKSTEGVVLLGSQKKILKAFYHADCGGATSSAKSVWGNGDISAGETESCPAAPRTLWSLELSQKALTQKLAKVLNLTSDKVLVTALEPHRQHSEGGAEGRADSIVVGFSNGEKKTILADTFRAQLGYGQLKSTQFEVQKTQSNHETEFVFHGKGFGHGVGLCQWGSRAMAMDKKSYRQILKHYYPLAEIQ